MSKSLADVRFMCIDTGLVGLKYDCPLVLLDARFARLFGTRQLDIQVQCLIGPLAIDLTDEINTAKQQNYTTEAQKLPLFREGFIGKLYDMYQWRMLLMARAQPAVRRKDNNSDSFWQSLVGTARPEFAPLELYIGSDGDLSWIYGPNPSTKTNAIEPPQGLVRGLPKISMPNAKQGGGALAVHMQKDYAFYNYSSESKGLHGWAECVCYTLVKTPPPAGAAAGAKPRAATAAFEQVKFSEYTKVFHPKMVLLPFHTGVHSPAIAHIPNHGNLPWLRCVILVDYDSVNHDAVFWGIGDFLGITDKPEYLDNVAITLE